MSDATALEMRTALRRGDASAIELAQAALQRAEDRSALGAFISLTPELAIAEAAAADRRRAADRPDEPTGSPPLLGVPTAHKDLVAVRGAVTTHGSRAVPHRVAEHDDPIAAAVRAAGAFSIGKTQVPEFGIAGYSENELAPPARNPADPALTAGGSSGGTAAAIAAGVIPAAIASDAGGSIRIPAAACGLIGLKPGRNVVPADRRRGPLDDFGAPRMAASGPIARTAYDAAALFDAILGRPDEPTLAAARRTEELRGLRIGISLDSPFAARWPIRFSAEALSALDAAVARLEAFGHHVEEARFAYDPRYPEAFTTSWISALGRLDLSADAAARLGALARAFRERARATPPETLTAATAALRSFARDATRQWGAFDAVLTPALAFAPPAVGAFRALGPEGDYRLQCEWAPQTSMVNVAGLPAVTAPASRTAPTPERPSGLPMGVQLIGRDGDEARLLQLAAQLTA